jgi:hypothetical protein
MNTVAFALLSKVETHLDFCLGSKIGSEIDRVDSERKKYIGDEADRLNKNSNVYMSKLKSRESLSQANDGDIAALRDIIASFKLLISKIDKTITTFYSGAAITHSLELSDINTPELDNLNVLQTTMRDRIKAIEKFLSELASGTSGHRTKLIPMPGSHGDREWVPR